MTMPYPAPLPSPTSALYAGWLCPIGAPPVQGTASFAIFKEAPAARPTALPVLRAALVAHYKGLNAIARLGFEEAAKRARVKLPTTKRTRSGELGELLAAEYVTQKTDYFLPINKLQRKDSRDLPLRGADILALRKDGSKLPRVLKGESKSKATMVPAVIQEAIMGVENNDGRPSPFDWAFVADYLWEIGEDDLAQFVEDCQTSSTTDAHFEHLVFALCGNDPAPRLTSATGASTSAIKRQYVGVQVEDHADLVDAIYDSV